jgi:hypothetical protein
MTDKYILDGKTPVPCDDVLEWAKLFGTERHVGETDVNGARVSTVFLGLDHSFGKGPPLLFETMIFGGEHNEYQERYSTWEEAEEGHKRAVAMIGEKP